MTEHTETSGSMIVAVSTLIFEALFNPVMLGIYAMTALFLGYDALNKGWKNSLTHRMTTGIGATILLIALNSLMIPTVVLCVDWVAGAYDALGVPHLPTAVWVGVPLILVAGFGMICGDFVDYLTHRAMHWKWLWPIHAVHHSDEDVNGLTTFRVHVLEVLLMQVSHVLLLTWLGMPAEAQGLGATLLLLHNVYVHSRIDWTHGPVPPSRRFAAVSPVAPCGCPHCARQEPRQSHTALGQAVRHLLRARPVP